MKFTTLLLLCGVLFSTAIFAAEPVPPPMNAVRLHEKVAIDGVLDEAAWSTPGYSNLHQQLPKEGAAPMMKTEFWVAYDDDAIYVAARMYDPHPDSISARLTRRDGWADDDVFYVAFDPYHDKRTGYYFGLSAAGTYTDGTYANDEWTDDSWDGIWEGAAKIDSVGWTAEFRIPFSQLRFHNFGDQIWGVDVQRYVPRYRESDYVTYTPANGAGFVSRFVELHGIGQIPAPTRFELLPYTTGKGAFLQHSIGDPYNTGSRYTPGIGADVKMGLGSNLTLDGTINPDFGQVEIDPAVINLSDQETFFWEKRPFFLEGTNVFRFGIGGGNYFPNYSYFDPMFFNSRRIGRAPQGSLPSSYDFADVPSGTNIIGAAKLTGKFPGDHTLGVVQAVTEREYASIDSAGIKSSREVEPVTSYTAARVRKEFDGGQESIGIISLNTIRSFNDMQLRNELPGGGYVFGIDGWTFFDNEQSWVLTGYVAGSHLTGTPSAMIAAQTNSRHYYNRPDAKSFHVDSNATSLNGYTARFWLNKQKGNWLFNAAVGVQTPGLDMNDLGLSYKADNINSHVQLNYRTSEPGEFFRDVFAGVTMFQSFNFDGNNISRGWNSYFTGDFTNYYHFNFNVGANFKALSDTKTRGGPLMIQPANSYVSFSFSTDARLPYTFAIGPFFSTNINRPMSWGLNADLTWKVTNSLYLDIGPGIDIGYNDAQYVTTVTDSLATATYGNRYMFSALDQKTIAASIRLNWTFTPSLSLQCFVQPYISTGKYHDFKELARPGSYEFNVYGTNGSVITRADGVVSITPFAGDTRSPIEVSDPDFNYRSFRINAVLRWEYLPGSTLYFVWTQTRASTDIADGLDVARDNRLLFGVAPDNVFLVKASYWLPL